MIGICTACRAFPRLQNRLQPKYDQDQASERGHFNDFEEIENKNRDVVKIRSRQESLGALASAELSDSKSSRPA